MQPRRLSLVIAAAMLFAAAAPARAGEGASVAEIKAAAVVNFLLFAHWPQELAPETPLRLCTFADEAIEQLFSRHEGKRIRTTTLVLQHLDRHLGEASACSAVFVDTGNPVDLRRVVAATRGRPILVMAVGEGSLQEGAMIALSVAGGRVVFDVRLDAARAAGIDFSAKLLQLARNVLR
jgi:hypothetical protein